MTTIAFKFNDDGTGIMAADSSCSDDGTHIGGVKKVWRVGKCLIGMAGEIASFKKFVEWYRSGADDEALFPWGTEINALVVGPDGSMKFYECQNSMDPVPLSKRDKFVAIGSGMGIAMGCMYQGGSASDAVKAAIRYDGNSKGPVRTYKL